MAAGNEISDAGAFALADTLRCNTTLRVLALQSKCRPPLSDHLECFSPIRCRALFSWRSRKFSALDKRANRLILIISSSLLRGHARCVNVPSDNDICHLGCKKLVVVYEQQPTWKVLHLEGALLPPVTCPPATFLLCVMSGLPTPLP